MGLTVSTQIEVLSSGDADFHPLTSKMNDCLSIASVIIESLKLSKGRCSAAK